MYVVLPVYEAASIAGPRSVAQYDKTSARIMGLAHST